MNKCYGCGITLQNTDKKKDGYVDDLEKGLCQRCFRIKYYGQYKESNKNNNDYLEIINKINKNSLVLYVTSIIDINIDYLESFKNVILVITKKDLLPKSIKDKKIKEYFKYFNLTDIEVISSIKNYNIDELYNKINKYKTNKNVYIVGNTNSGKSTLLNKLITNYSETYKDITTSVYPSTTLNEIKVKINDDLTIIDTPGIVDENNIVNNIAINRIKSITPKKEIKPRTYQVKGVGCLVIEDIARINYNAKEETSFTIYIANNLKITRVGVNNERLLNLDRIGFLLPKNKDIVIEGLCFIKFVGEIDLDIYIDKNIKVHSRDNLI